MEGEQDMYLFLIDHKYGKLFSSLCRKLREGKKGRISLNYFRTIFQIFNYFVFNTIF